jgi:protease-4
MVDFTYQRGLFNYNTRRGNMRFIKSILEFISKYFKSLLFLLILYLVFAPSKSVELKKPNLMKIDINGAIFDDKEFLKKIEEAQKRYIKGVLIEINSPGGAVAPSVEMSLAVKRLKDKKPVVAYAKGMMTSGSYYASIWADKIVANPGSMIGSIGVIFDSVNIEELASKIGIKEQVVKAGKYKQIGTPTRKWKDFEKAELEKVINNTYKMFVTDVANARGLKITDKDKFADAHIFTAQGAKKVGLIDKVGSIYDAKELLYKLAKVKNPVWKKEDRFDKFLDKVISKIGFSIYSNFYGLKAW